MASPNTQASSDNQAYAESLGITADYIAKAEKAYVAGQVELAQLAAMPPRELQALHLHAYQLLRAGKAQPAARVFLALSQLDRRDARYLIGLGQCFQASHEFGWAQSVFEAAIRADEGNRIAWLLYAEMTILLSGRERGVNIMRRAVAMGPRDPDDVAYIERAKGLLRRLLSPRPKPAPAPGTAP